MQGGRLGPLGPGALAALEAGRGCPPPHLGCDWCSGAGCRWRSTIGFFRGGVEHALLWTSGGSGGRGPAGPGRMARPRRCHPEMHIDARPPAIGSGLAPVLRVAPKHYMQCIHYIYIIYITLNRLYILFTLYGLSTLHALNTLFTVCTLCTLYTFFTL